MHRLAPLVLALVLALAGCDSPTALEDRDHIEFTNLRRMEPEPDVYQRWHTDVALCMERPAAVLAYGRIEWHVADRIRFTDRSPGGARETRALWSSPHYITIRTDRVDARVTVQHEIVHDLLQDGGHEHPAFDACVG